MAWRLGFCVPLTELRRGPRAPSSVLRPPSSVSVYTLSPASLATSRNVLRMSRFQPPGCSRLGDPVAIRFYLDVPEEPQTQHVEKQRQYLLSLSPKLFSFLSE